MTDLGLFTISTIGSVVAVGAGLAVLIIRITSRLDRPIDRTNDRIGHLDSSLRTDLGGRTDSLGTELRTDLGGRIESLGTELGGRIDRVEQGQAELRERMAKLEGLLEGLREAITRRRVA